VTKEKFLKNKLKLIEKYKQGVKTLENGYMKNLRLVDYFDMVERYKNAMKKVIKENGFECS
jgi:hypothetical protein